VCVCVRVCGQAPVVQILTSERAGWEIMVPRDESVFIILPLRNTTEPETRSQIIASLGAASIMIVISGDALFALVCTLAVLAQLADAMPTTYTLAQIRNEMAKMALTHLADKTDIVNALFWSRNMEEAERVMELALVEYGQYLKTEPMCATRLASTRRNAASFMVQFKETSKFKVEYDTKAPNRKDREREQPWPRHPV
jgi:hypothetical protein